jgi:hypothetical protein
MIESQGRIAPTSPLAPTRVIVRAASEFMLQGVAEGMKAFGSLRRVVIFTAIVVANVQPITRSAVRTWRYADLDHIPPDSLRRPVSITGLAASLGSPFETTRNNVAALIEDGFCTRVETGVIVPNAVLQSPALVAMDAALSASFWKMIEDLKALGFDFEQVRGRKDVDSDLGIEPDFRPADGQGSPRRLISRVTSEFYLASILGGSAPFEGDWTACAVFGAVMSINAEAMGKSPDEAWRYARADTPPPDAVRRPATIREVAARLNLDRESARRHVHGLIKGGRVIKGDKGYLANTAYMQTPLSQAAAVEMTKAFYRMIYDLTALGVEL